MPLAGMERFAGRARGVGGAEAFTGGNMAAPSQGGWGTMMNRLQSPEDAAPAGATPGMWGRMGGEGMLGAAPPSRLNLAGGAPAREVMAQGAAPAIDLSAPPSMPQLELQGQTPPGAIPPPLAPAAAPIGRGPARGAGPPPNLGSAVRAGGQESLGTMAGNLAGGAGGRGYSRANNPRRAAREARMGRGR